MKYTIISSLTNYGVTQIKPFVESINKSGYSGEKFALQAIYARDSRWLFLSSIKTQSLLVEPLSTIKIIN